MRCLGLIVAAALIVFCNLAPRRLAAEEPTFPYTAYANTDDVYVRSGPGKNYYPTEKLKRGDAVEVYRHDPGGWYAIRPPHGSFSWVPARLLQPTKDHLAVVVGDRVVSRVGSGMSDVPRRDSGSPGSRRASRNFGDAFTHDRGPCRSLVQDHAAVGRVSLGFRQARRFEFRRSLRLTPTAKRRSRTRDTPRVIPRIDAIIWPTSMPMAIRMLRRPTAAATSSVRAENHPPPRRPMHPRRWEFRGRAS